MIFSARHHQDSGSDSEKETEEVEEESLGREEVVGNLLERKVAEVTVSEVVATSPLTDGTQKPLHKFMDTAVAAHAAK